MSTTKYRNECLESKVKKSPEHNQPNFINGFLWGTIVGGLGMFMFGTKSGKRVKEFLTEHGEQLLDELEETYKKGNLKKEVIKKLTSVKPKKQAQKLEGKKQEKQDDKKKALDSAKQDLSHIQKLQERGRDAAQQFFTRRGKTLK